MKRFLIWLVCLAMAAGLCLPALAAGEEPVPEAEEPVIDVGMLEPGEGTISFPVPEDGEGMDAALAAVTLQVKQTLDVDDGYTEFYGDYRDSIVPRWELNWSDETRQLTVEAAPDGTVTHVYRWTSTDDRDWFRGFDPSFPPLTLEEATAQADGWLDRLLTGAESARVDSVHTGLGAEGTYTFYGTVLKNGLESPVEFSLILDAAGVSSFYRSDSYMGYVGQLPPAEAAADEARAAQALAGAVELELRWVSDGEGGARLMYMPVGPYTVADAQTGEAVDMDALYASFDSERGMNGYGAAETAEAEDMSAAGGVSLTEVELASIADYEDVMDAEAIDEALRSIDMLGLDGFQQDRCSYAVASETGAVTASVRYTKTMTADQLYGYSPEAFARAAEDGQDLTIYKYIDLDAASGGIRSVYTSYPLWEKAEGMMGLVNQAGIARQFVALALPELAAQAEPCTLHGYDEGEDLIFAQVQAGYFFPDNYIRVHVDPTSGTVDQFYYAWDEEISFGPAEDLISPEEALAAYTDALDVTLGYVAWPVDVTLEENAVYAKYLDWGYTYVEELRLAYYYGGLDRVQGVDAVTGEAVSETQDEDAYAYDDLDEVPQADMIRRLGLAGIGFPGGAFGPEQALTVRDGAMLLLQADGYGAAFYREDDERMLDQASYRGFLAGDEDLDAPVSRMDFLRMMLGASRYGSAAALEGVWACGFDDVDGADAGYAAVARALGLAEGDALAPEETLTRADGAELLYRFMDR